MNYVLPTSVDPFDPNFDALAWFKAQLQAAGQELLVVGDFGEDLDDEVTTLLADGERRRRNLAFFKTAGSREQNLFELKAVVANLAPPRLRARLAKGTLKTLGQPNVPVGVGTDCGNLVGEKEKKLQNIPYMAGDDEVEADGRALLERALRQAKDNSITLVLISGLTDIAEILRQHEDLVKQKVRSIAIMGGVELKKEKISGPDGKETFKDTDEVLLDADGYMLPDSAANNKFDMDSAKFVYRKFQELAIPMVILTRHAAGGCKVPRKFYDDLAATGHPVGIKLRDAQKTSIESLWKRANMAADDPHREKLPERCNKEWFCKAFLGGDGMDRNGEDSIWDLVKTFMLYDPMTLVAAVPMLRDRFFSPVEVQVNGTVHLIIGVSPTKTCVKDAEGLRDYMVNRCIESLVLSLEEAEKHGTVPNLSTVDAASPPTPPPNGVGTSTAS